MKRSPQRGFTLIELLVVIAIIGLLGTMSVVSFSSSREKARLAKGAGFSAQVLRTTGDELIGRWDFDECSGTIAYDQSGFNNNGTLVAGQTWPTNTPTGKGCAVNFNGSTHYVNAGNTPSLNIPTGGSVTMCAWINSNKTTYQGLIAKRDTSAVPYAYGINFFPTNFQIYTSGASGVQGFTYTLPANKWTHFCGVISATEPTKLFVDGSLFGSKGPGGGVAVNGANLTIGASYAGAEYVQGDIDDVRVYARSLTSQDIHQLYAEGKANHNIARVSR